MEKTIGAMAEMAESLRVAAEAMRNAVEMMNAPKKVIRDKNGRVVGVERME
jgi:hypothetical protein